MVCDAALFLSVSGGGGTRAGGGDSWGSDGSGGKGGSGVYLASSSRSYWLSLAVPNSVSGGRGGGGGPGAPGGRPVTNGDRRPLLSSFRSRDRDGPCRLAMLSAPEVEWSLGRFRGGGDGGSSLGGLHLGTPILSFEIQASLVRKVVALLLQNFQTDLWIVARTPGSLVWSF